MQAEHGTLPFSRHFELKQSRPHEQLLKLLVEILQQCLAA
jgi:hypothetical protein